jgi:putative transposase
MAAKKRKKHAASFKAQGALAAIKGDKTVNELALEYSVHPTLIHAWKKQLVHGAEAVFADSAKATTDAEAAQARLYEQIGRLQVELDWVKKKLPPDPDALRLLVDPGHPTLSVRRQCRLLGLSRSSYYYLDSGEEVLRLRPAI